jgi:hypothetical protein
MIERVSDERNNMSLEVCCQQTYSIAGRRKRKHLEDLFWLVLDIGTITTALIALLLKVLGFVELIAVFFVVPRR